MRRRSYLSLLFSGALGTVGGCQGTRLESSDTRIKAEPPGSPPLAPTGSWPVYRYNSGNTGYNPNGEGLRDADLYWKLDAGSVATIADDALYNLYGSWNYSPEPVGNADPRAERFGSTDLVRREPATAGMTSRTELEDLYTQVNAPPTIGTNGVFVSSYVRTYCLSRDAEQILWQSPEMNGIRGPPILRDGSVYIAALNGPGTSEETDNGTPQVRSFSTDSGSSEWRYELRAKVRSPPAVTDDTVVVNANNGLHVIDAESGDGRVLVDYDSDTIQYGTPVATADSFYVIVRSEDGSELLAIDTDSGSIRWRVSVPGLGQQTPVVTEDTVYIGKSEGLVALNTTDATESVDLSGGRTPLARVGATVYASTGNYIEAMDAMAGERLWSYETSDVRVGDVSGGGILGVTPVTNAVYVRAADGLYGFGSSG